MRNILILGIVSILFCCSLSKTVEIAVSAREIDIKQNQILKIQAIPDYDLSNIDLKQRFGDTYSFSNICRIKTAYLDIQPSSAIHFEEQQNKSQIIYQLQDLKNIKNVADFAQFKGFYYVVFKQGYINVYTKREKGLEKLGNLLYNKTLSSGYLAQNKQSLVYVSNQELLLINQTHIRQINSYQALQNLSYVRLFEYGHLFISDQVQGFYYYHLNSNTLELSNKTYINLAKILNQSSVQIQDFVYDSNSKTFIVSDSFKGVHFFKFQNLTFNKIDKHINKTGCLNLALQNEMLYLTCSQLIRFNTSSTVMQTKSTNFYAQDLIVTAKQEIILVGEQYISYYQNWNWYPTFGELIEPQRLTYKNEDLVYINSYGLINQKLKFIPQNLICQTDKQGYYQIVLYSQSKCNRNIFVNRYSQSQINEDDNCRYLSKVNIQVWEAFSIKWIFITIGALICLTAIIIFIIWVIIKRRLANKAYNTLVEIQEIHPTEDNFKDNKSLNIDDRTGRQLANESTNHQ